MDNHGEKKEGLSGNTKRQTQGKRWAFTWNNYELDDLEKLESCFRKHNIMYVYGLEVGSSGTKHIQGYIETTKKHGIRPIEYLGLPKQIHWEKAKAGMYENFNYCTKDDNYYTNFLCERKDMLIKHTPYSELYDWQQAIVDLHDREPDRRTVYWLWESQGCSGKTFVAKWLTAHRQGVVMATCTKSADILTLANNNIKTYIINIARSNEWMHPWAALEQLKDGYITDCKLKKEGRVINCAPPHVIVLANFKPERRFLSEDRWAVIKL